MTWHDVAKYCNLNIFFHENPKSDTWVGYLQEDSWGVGMTVGDDFLGLCDQKSSYQHGSCSQWLWCYRLFLTHLCEPCVTLHGVLYASATERKGVT
jgi:hypothetical protein